MLEFKVGIVHSAYAAALVQADPSSAGFVEIRSVEEVTIWEHGHEHCTQAINGPSLADRVTQKVVPRQFYAFYAHGIHGRWQRNAVYFFEIFADDLDDRFKLSGLFSEHSHIVREERLGYAARTSN